MNAIIAWNTGYMAGRASRDEEVQVLQTACDEMTTNWHNALDPRDHLREANAALVEALKIARSTLVESGKRFARISHSNHEIGLCIEKIDAALALSEGAKPSVARMWHLEPLPERCNCWKSALQPKETLDEIDRLEMAIREAPHSFDCDYGVKQSECLPLGKCNCWKSKALND